MTESERVRNIFIILYDAILTSYLCMTAFSSNHSLKHRGGSRIAAEDRIERNRRVVIFREERSGKTEQDKQYAVKL